MYNSPQATDYYTRFMASSFDDRNIINVPTGFQAFFGRPESGGQSIFSPDALSVEIDIIRGNQKIAPLIQRGSVGRIIKGQKNTQEEKYSNFARVFPLIEEEGDLNAAQILLRLAGDSAFAAKSKIDRMRMLALSTHTEHIRRIARTFELLASLSVRTGKMPAKIGTTNSALEYDFRRNAAHTITPIAKWDLIATDILGDIDTGCGKVQENGHVKPDMLILGSGAMTSLLKNTDVKALADNRRFEIIQISSKFPVPQKYERFIKAGFNARGLLRTPEGYELWMFTYVETYVDLDGNVQKYMPADEAVLASSDARCDRYFGPSEVLPAAGQDNALYNEYFGFSPMATPMPMNIADQAAAISPEMFYSDAYRSTDKKTISIRTQAAPIFATTMTDGFLTFTSVLT